MPELTKFSYGRTKGWLHLNKPNWVIVMQCKFFQLIITVVGLVLSLGLTGCSGSEDDRQPVGQAADRTAAAASGTVDACALLALSEIANIVGNPVLEGRAYAGPEVCQWQTENTDHISVLLTAHRAGSVRANVLCDDLGAVVDSGEPLANLGDKATFKFSGVAGMFDSGDLAACGAEGFVSVSLNGKKGEAEMKEAAITMTRMVLSRL